MSPKRWYLITSLHFTTSQKNEGLIHTRSRRLKLRAVAKLLKKKFSVFMETETSPERATSSYPELNITSSCPYNSLRYTVILYFHLRLGEHNFIRVSLLSMLATCTVRHILLFLVRTYVKIVSFLANAIHSFHFNCY